MSRLSRPARRILLTILAALAAGTFLAPGHPARAQESLPERGMIILVIEGISFEQLLAVPEVRSLATAGGAGLVVPQEPVDVVLDRLPPGQVLPGLALNGTMLSGPDGSLTVASLPGGEGEPPSRERIARFLRGLEHYRISELTVVLLASDPSSEMQRGGDEVLPIVMAAGSPRELLSEASGEGGTVTSDTTRRDGVVSSSDLVPTAYRFLGRPVPDGEPGSSIRVVGGPPPYELHARYLAMRRMSVPIQVAAGLYVFLAAAALVMLLVLRDRLSQSLLHGAAWIGLSVAPLAVALLAAGHLPTLSYETLVPFVVGVTLVGTLAAVPLVRRGILAPPAAIGWAVLASFAVEAATGWSAALTPFLGGSQLDGGRFFGLPNAFEGLIAGAALYAVATRRTALGVAVLVGAALLMGLPQLGANLGGAITAFTAAGIWLALRTRERLDLPALGLAALVAAAGTGAVLVIHRLLPGTPTHVTRFVSGESGGLLERFVDRVEVGLDLIARNPFAILPALGIVAVLVVVLRPPAPVRLAFERLPRWRDAMLALSISGVTALVVNDTGPAATGLAFGLALGGMLYASLMCVSLAPEPRKMEGHEPAAAAVD